MSQAIDTKNHAGAAALRTTFQELPESLTILGVECFRLAANVYETADDHQHMLIDGATYGFSMEGFCKLVPRTNYLIVEAPIVGAIILAGGIPLEDCNQATAGCVDGLTFLEFPEVTIGQDKVTIIAIPPRQQIRISQEKLDGIISEKFPNSTRLLRVAKALYPVFSN